MDIAMFERLEIPLDAEVCVIEPPEDYPTESVDIFTGVEGSQFDVVKVYVSDPDLFAENVAEGLRIMKPEGTLWVAWPKEKDSDFGTDFITGQAAPLGLKPEKQVELDEGWNAVKMDII